MGVTFEAKKDFHAAGEYYCHSSKKKRDMKLETKL